MQQVRIGVIGLGNMGSGHAKTFVPETPNAVLTAVCDVIPEKMDGYDVSKFTSSSDLIRSGLVDAIVIATPHYDHTPIGVEAFGHGLHVVVEKPISAHVADADRLIAAHNSELVFAAMFQTRTSNAFQTLKRIIDSGELGPIRRINWIITNWFRSAAYYASSEWRATWKGEGGGVLLNQCPHNLDILQWLFGMPTKISASCGFGRFHEIEVEDCVSAHFDYPSGATGVFVTSTGEAPGTDRLEIAGDRGRLVFEDGQMFIDETSESVQNFCDTTPESFPSLETTRRQVPLTGQSGTHAKILENFVQAILTGQALISPAEEGLNSLELANAMLLTSWLQQPVRLPLDRHLYVQELTKRIDESKFTKKLAKNVVVDMAASFH
jgi:predicted dehydrogenase